jgi:endonuclease-3
VSILSQFSAYSASPRETMRAAEVNKVNGWPRLCRALRPCHPTRSGKRRCSCTSGCARPTAAPSRNFHHLDPLSELVSSLLSHRTTNRASGRAFRRLRERFATWEAVRDAPVAEVEEAVAECTWPEQKAPRIQEVLREITIRREGALSLDFLGELPVAEARAWLEALRGVGPKTSAAVLLFSILRMPALPVDSHHHRVAARLGLIPPNVAVGPAHRLLEAQLPPGWSAQQVYDNHEALMLHGQRCCFFRSPARRRCPVLELCPYGRARTGADPGARDLFAAAGPSA